MALGEIGRVFHGRYRIDRELWRAPHLLSLLVTDLRNGRPCVLRRLSVASAPPEDLRRFEAQAAIFARLNHAGLPRFIEGFVDEESGDRILVTSYHPGESLERLVAKGRPLTEPQAVALLRRLVPVLSYLHGFDPPLVHRAIKPTGIVVGPDGRPCITAIDFVVPELEVPVAEPAPPRPEELAQAAPEVLAGRSVPASDVYALGLVIVRGMASVNPAELLRDNVRQRLRDVLGVSEAFAAMLAQMLDPSLERRYPEAQALETDLAKLAGAKIEGPPKGAKAGTAPSPPQRAQPLPRPVQPEELSPVRQPGQLPEPAPHPVRQSEEPAGGASARRTSRPLIAAVLALGAVALVAVAVRLRTPPSPESGTLLPPVGETRQQATDTKAPAEAPPAAMTAAVPQPPGLAGTAPAAAPAAPAASESGGGPVPSPDVSAPPTPAPEVPSAAPVPIPVTVPVPAAGPTTADAPIAPAATALTAPGDIVFEGRLLYEGKPFTSATAPQPVFWFRNESTKVVEKPGVEYADGIFRVRGLQPGRYGISVRIDLDRSNPNLFPGDLSAWSEANLEAGRPASVDFTLRKHIRLKQPVDNGFAIPRWEVPCGAGNPTPGQVVFAWEPVGAAASYEVRIDRLACNRGYAVAGSVLARTTAESWMKVELSPNNAEECYSLKLTARKDGRTVGILATHGANGVGWDYRFAVMP